MDLKKTLNLPDADFTIPMKADLPTREPEMQKKWAEMGIYKTICDARRGREKFTLHDGPPYTNNMVHIGTAFQKSLKDFVVKYKTLRGYYSPYVPGFDNHGLPIELAVQERIGKNATPEVMRRECREHAENYIRIQTVQFERFGVFGDWRHPYKTMAFAYEAAIVRAFASLAKKGFIYRDLKPTHWSTHSKTALADTELVYESHTSTAIFVRFELKTDPNKLFKDGDPLFAIIWTTTPWTIPANLALAFHPELKYAIVKTDHARYLLYEGLVEKTMQTLEINDWVIQQVVEGAQLEGSVFEHPIFERDSIAVLADYVNTEEGTGVVHTAPGHGADDFYTGRKYGLPALCPVDEGGVFTDEAGEFSGLHITKGGARVVERLEETGNLLKSYSYEHQYPYSERDKNPVIFRTTEQWFLRVDHNDLRKKALEQIKNVSWFPRSGEHRISSMIESRPDWCLSRQRIWGVGIPILYGMPSRVPVLDFEIMENVAKLVEQRGSSAWFECELSDILPAGYKHPETGETEFAKESDVLDVWFDSGVTHLAVLSDKYESAWSDLDWPADLYLEGSDQHRGWFNSSLMTAVAIKGAAPYRIVVTHGFVTDEQGRKMSKSLGNVVEPMEAAGKYGADVMRLWTGSVNYMTDVPCGDNLLKQVGDSYRRIRNTLRFLLANLYDLESELAPELCMDLDEWAVDQTKLLERKVCDEFDQFDFSAATALVHNFCARELSAFYLDAIKDRMYCDAASSPERRSGQEACRQILLILTRLIAPVLMHTAEEVYSRIPLKDRKVTVFVEEIAPEHAQACQAMQLSDLHQRFSQLLAIRDRLNTELENWKAESGVKDSQDVSVTINANQQEAKLLDSFGPELATMLKLSSATIIESSEEFFEFQLSTYLKCERCRLRRADVELHNDIPLCKRCLSVVSSQN